MVKKGEKVIFGFLLLLATIVILVQILLCFPPENSVFFAGNRSETGVGEEPLRKMAQLSLETSQSEPGVFVVINGKKEENFYNKKITIFVQENSFVSVSAEGVNHPVSVEITNVSEFVKRENLRLKWRGKGEKFLVGQILFQ